jgi:hypothetical protein
LGGYRGSLGRGGLKGRKFGERGYIGSKRGNMEKGYNVGRGGMDVARALSIEVDRKREIQQDG